MLVRNVSYVDLIWLDCLCNAISVTGKKNKDLIRLGIANVKMLQQKNAAKEAVG